MDQLYFQIHIFGLKRARPTLNFKILANITAGYFVLIKEHRPFYKHCCRSIWEMCSLLDEGT